MPPRISPHIDHTTAGILAAAINRLAAAVEEHNRSLGSAATTRYTRPPNGPDLVDERTMAGILSISYRTLGKHRRDGRLPGCWVRNGGRIFWIVDDTVAAWRGGVA